MQKLHEWYGDVVRISPSELSYRQVKAKKDIYGSLNESPIMRWAQILYITSFHSFLCNVNTYIVLELLQWICRRHYDHYYR